MDPATTPHQLPAPKSRTAMVVGGIVSAVLAVGLIVGGGALIWADTSKDADGYLMTGKHHFAAKTAAMRTENMDINLDGADWLVGEDMLGKVRIKADSENGKPVFIGIARTSAVDRYLEGVASTTVTDLDYAPFHVSYRSHPGTNQAVPPGKSRIWAASTHGNGRQTLNWEMKEGDWSVVVMNADGSPGIAAKIKTGASIPVLTPLAWTTMGAGILFAILATGLLLSADRPRRQEARAAAEPALA